MGRTTGLVCVGTEGSEGGTEGDTSKRKGPIGRDRMAREFVNQGKGQCKREL